MQTAPLLAGDDANGAPRELRLLERVIANLPLFRQVARHQITDIASLSRMQRFRRGKDICGRGERLPGVIVVAYGQVKLALRRGVREEKVVRFVGPNESFGEAAALLRRPCPLDAVALADTMIAVVPTRCLLRLIDADSGFARSLVGVLADRFLGLLTELEASVQQRSVQRLANYLDSLAEPGEVPGTWAVRLPVSKTALAARLGFTKETMSRLLRSLADRGLIAVARHNISILDRTGLVKMAD